MLSTRPACSRAIRRQNQTQRSVEAIWVSDDLLVTTFERFCALPRSHVRHGSWVPGPLECRRRSGKRRMAYTTDPLSPLWGNRDSAGWLGSMKELSWRWRPPTTATERHESNNIVLQLPPWLARWVLGPDISTTEVVTSPTSDRQSTIHAKLSFERKQLLDFRQLMLNTNEKSRQVHCDDFIRYIQHSFTAGMVEEELVSECLSSLTETIYEAFPDTPMALRHLEACYTAILAGMNSCTIRPMSDYAPATMDRFLSVISDLPISMKSKNLVQTLLEALTNVQLSNMSSGLFILLRSWLTSCRAESSEDNYEGYILSAEQTVESTVLEMNLLFGRLQRLVPVEGTMRVSNDDLRLARKTIISAKDRIGRALRAVSRCEDILLPMRAPIWHLIDCLQPLGQSKMRTISTACMREIQRFYEIMQSRMHTNDPNYRIVWLSLLARMPMVDHALFYDTWKSIESKGFYIPDNLGSDLLFNHMNSQGIIKYDTRWMRNAFEGHPLSTLRKDYGSLLAAIYSYETEGHWSSTARYVIETLYDLGRYHGIARALASVRKHPRKPPIRLLRRTISSIARVNPRLALKLHKSYIPDRFSSQYYDASRSPDFIVALIKDEFIAPATIWKILDIPIYETFQGRRPRRSNETLPPAWIQLITKMASAFSTSKVRSQRAALRNVAQCMYHLHRYGVPISGQMSRAITRAGITREILRDNWVGVERKRWILDKISSGEGEHVANEVESMVDAWNKTVGRRRASHTVVEVRSGEEETGSAL